MRKMKAKIVACIVAAGLMLGTVGGAARAEGRIGASVANTPPRCTSWVSEGYAWGACGGPAMWGHVVRVVANCALPNGVQSSWVFVKVGSIATVFRSGVCFIAGPNRVHVQELM
jgi:hypothetical protein